MITGSMRFMPIVTLGHVKKTGRYKFCKSRSMMKSGMLNYVTMITGTDIKIVIQTDGELSAVRIL